MLGVLGLVMLGVLGMVILAVLAVLAVLACSVLGLARLRLRGVRRRPVAVPGLQLRDTSYPCIHIHVHRHMHIRSYTCAYTCVQFPYLDYDRGDRRTAAGCSLRRRGDYTII